MISEKDAHHNACRDVLEDIPDADIKNQPELSGMIVLSFLLKRRVSYEDASS
jgi:hypothetical protein